MSLNVNILRVIGYKHKILLKNHPIKNYYGRYLPYHKFVNLFVIHYSNVSMDEHIGLINAIPKSKIQIYSEYIHNFLRKSNVHTNWTPTSIATILMSTRVFNITFQPATRLQLTSGLDDCPICYEPIQPKYYCNLGCNHRFCSTCILTYINTLYISNVIQPICPLCRTDITNFTTPIENYKDCIHAISKIRNIEVIGDASEEHEAILNTENRLHERTEAPGFVSDNRTYDDRVIRPVRQMPINIRTRGYPTEYQQMGILTNRNNLKDIKPLYGRQTYQGSNQWNYYTSTDSDLALKIPITIKGRKCTDEHGCQELYEKDHVEVNGNKYDIEKYSNDEFRYIPYVF